MLTMEDVKKRVDGGEHIEDILKEVEEKMVKGEEVVEAACCLYHVHTGHSWNTLKGRTVDIGEMEDLHLVNTVAMLERDVSNLEYFLGVAYAPSALPVMLKEAERRKALRAECKLPTAEIVEKYKDDEPGLLRILKVRELLKL